MPSQRAEQYWLPLAITPAPFLLASWFCARGTAPGTPRHEGDGCLLPPQPSMRVPTGGTAVSTSVSALVGLTRAAAAQVTTSTRTRGPAPVRVLLPPCCFFLSFFICFLLILPLSLSMLPLPLLTFPALAHAGNKGSESPQLYSVATSRVLVLPHAAVGPAEPPCQPPPASFSPQ